MGVSSMTGFARAEGEADGISWVWELKSVNSRSLDLRLRLPPGFDGLEPELRASLARRCRRGNVVGQLCRSTGPVPPAIRINREMLAQIVALTREVAASDRCRAAAARRADRPARRSSRPSRTSRSRSSRRAAPRCWTAGRRRSTGWPRARAEEGARLVAVLSAQRAELAALVEAAAGCAAAQPAGDPRAARSAARASLPGSRRRCREERVAQEVAMLVTRADVREELDRLRAHIAQAGELLRARRRGRPAARFSLSGAEPRSQHAVLEIGRYRADPHRPGAEGGDRAVPRAGAEPRMSRRRLRRSPSRSAAAACCWCCPRPRGPARRRSRGACSSAIPTLSLSVSVTTRPPRPGEIDGQRLLLYRPGAIRRDGDGRRTARTRTRVRPSYGTPRRPIEEALAAGRDIVTDIDWQGTQQLERGAAAGPGHACSCCRRAWRRSKRV